MMMTSAMFVMVVLDVATRKKKLGRQLWFLEVFALKKNQDNELQFIILVE
jgi:hypothetical protein